MSSSVNNSSIVECKMTPLTARLSDIIPNHPSMRSFDLPAKEGRERQFFKGKHSKMEEITHWSERAGEVRQAERQAFRASHSDCMRQKLAAAAAGNVNRVTDSHSNPRACRTLTRYTFLCYFIAKHLRLGFLRGNSERGKS